MKILRHGELYNKVKCSFCKALLGYTIDDVYSKEIVNPFNEEEYTILDYVICPECKKKIFIKEMHYGANS